MSISVCSAVLRNNSKTQLFMTKQGANSDESRGARWTWNATFQQTFNNFEIFNWFYSPLFIKLNTVYHTQFNKSVKSNN